jgi:flagellar biosynthesis protein FlhG
MGPLQRATRKAPKIWAFGGGKGGVGKSLVCANLALTLAREGARCVVFDADLGGANLHTLIGLPAPRASLSQLLQRQVSCLSELLIPTAEPNLHLISGARGLMDIANPHHAQKEKILRQLVSLEADHIFLDLGAGSNFNILDFFLIAHLPILIAVPLPTSVENVYHFLKAAYYRKLKRGVRKLAIKHIVEKVLKDRVALGVRSPRQLLTHIEHLHPQEGAQLAREMKGFAPKLIVNQVSREKDMALGLQMAAACRDYFGIEVDFLAAIRNDERVHQAVRIGLPVIESFPQTSFSLTLRDLTRDLREPEELGHGT